MRADVPKPHRCSLAAVDTARPVTLGGGAAMFTAVLTGVVTMSIMVGFFGEGPKPLVAMIDLAPFMYANRGPVTAAFQVAHDYFLHLIDASPGINGVARARSLERAYHAADARARVNEAQEVFVRDVNAAVKLPRFVYRNGARSMIATSSLGASPKHAS